LYTYLKVRISTVEGSTILLASRTMLGECCLAAIQPKDFWTKLRAQERERESVCVCVCERERERENMKMSLQTMRIRLYIRSFIVSYKATTKTNKLQVWGSYRILEGELPEL
jgi:hypothetical protein